MITTLQTADKALKNYYLDAVTEQIALANPFFAAIEKTSESVYGKDVKKLVSVGLAGGISAGNETDDLPSGNAESFVEFTAPLKNLYGTIEISDKAMRASSADGGAVVNLLNAQMDNLVRSSKRNFSRMLFGNGSAKLATVATVDTTNKAVTVDTTQNLMEGMKVDHFAVTGTTDTLGAVITKIDRPNKKVYFDVATTNIETSQPLYLAGSKDKEMCGLETLFTGTTLYGLTKANYPWLTAYTKTINRAAQTPEALTVVELQKAIDKIEEYSGSTPNMILCSWGVRRVLQGLFSTGNISTNTEVLAGGYQAMTYNGIPVVVDPFCPAGTLYLVNTDDFKLCQLCDFTWMEDDAGAILHQIAGKAAYSATLVKYAELICVKPCGQGKISGISDD